MTALVNDPEIGTRPIEVRVTRGVVRLSGRVRSQAEVARAVALAQAVPGVTSVESSIRVGGDAPPELSSSNPPPAAREPAVEFAELEPSPGRLALGAAFGWSEPSTAAFESPWSAGPLVRLGSGAGLGPAMAFDWYRADVTVEPGSPAGRLHVRPIMAGVAYTVVAGRLAISPSLVGGYSFNRIVVPDTGSAGLLAVDAGNSLAWRPGVTIWVDTGRKTMASLSVGRLLTGVNITFVEAGVIEQRDMPGDATVVSIGFAYRLF